MDQVIDSLTIKDILYLSALSENDTDEERVAFEEC